MRPLELGLPLPTIGMPANKEAHTWEAISRIARQAEDIGFDTVWLPDELVWKFEPENTPMGTWECVAMCAAVAAVTERVQVGTWVLSALHRNPGLTAKVAETIDEISGGRFLFGVGSGHSGVQGKAFGFPPDRVVARYEESLEVIVPLVREGNSTFAGQFHSSFEQDNVPRGPQRDGMSLVLAGHGPRTIGLAVKYADIWSGYATVGSAPGEFTELLALVDKTCEEQSRDPDSLGRSIGVFLEVEDGALPPDAGVGVPLNGTPAQIAEIVHQFAELGVTMLEIIPAPAGAVAMEFLAELTEILDS